MKLNYKSCFQLLLFGLCLDGLKTNTVYGQLFLLLLMLNSGVNFLFVDFFGVLAGVRMNFYLQDI